MVVAMVSLQFRNGRNDIKHSRVRLQARLENSYQCWILGA